MVKGRRKMNRTPLFEARNKVISLRTPTLISRYIPNPCSYNSSRNFRSNREWFVLKWGSVWALFGNSWENEGSMRARIGEYVKYFEKGFWIVVLWGARGFAFWWDYVEFLFWVFPEIILKNCLKIFQSMSGWKFFFARVDWLVRNSLTRAAYFFRPGPISPA